jgi:hypothetical protein
MPDSRRDAHLVARPHSARPRHPAACAATRSLPLWRGRRLCRWHRLGRRRRGALCRNGGCLFE